MWWNRQRDSISTVGDWWYVDSVVAWHRDNAPGAELRRRHAPFLIAAVWADFFMGSHSRAVYGIMNVPVWYEIYPGIT